MLLSSLMNRMNPNDLSAWNNYAIIVCMGFNKKNITGKIIEPKWLTDPVDMDSLKSTKHKISGIYGMYDKRTGERIYIGQSRNVVRRMHDHRKDIREHSHSRTDLNVFNVDDIAFRLLVVCGVDAPKYNYSLESLLDEWEMREFLMIRPLKYGICPPRIDVHADAPSCVKIWKAPSNDLIEIMNSYDDGNGHLSFDYKLRDYDDIILTWTYDDFNFITDNSSYHKIGWNGREYYGTNERSVMVANIFEKASHDEKLAGKYGVPFITETERVRALTVDLNIQRQLTSLNAM